MKGEITKDEGQKVVNFYFVLYHCFVFACLLSCLTSMPLLTYSLQAFNLI